MPIFKAPIYTKLSSGQGATSIPCYTFAVEYLSSDKEDHLTSVAESASDLSTTVLNQLVKENHSWWDRFIQAFMTASAKLFSRPYSSEQLNRITNHVLPSPLPVITEYPTNIQWTVRQIKIYGGQVYIQWDMVHEPIQIDLPDTFSEPVQLPEELEEVDVEDLPAVAGAAGTTAMDPSQEYDRQRVKESRLKAKLAMYKAQYHMRLYYEKYGKECSDSDSDIESEYADEEDDEDDEDEYEEDVQL